jgi:hypothetical protein
MGCIIHPEHGFLGASPDGINVDEGSDLYGMLIEIKNVVSREINGVPKMEYWIQMQIQMECCNIDACHFIETKFGEYCDKDEYLLDMDVEYKGTIIDFGEGTYTAEIWKKEDENEVKEDEIRYIEIEPDNIKYWRLEKMSCIVVERNKDWFNKNVDKIKEIWELIQVEKVEGFEHRKPKSKKKVCML